MDQLSPKKPITLFQSEKKCSLHETTDQLISDFKSVYYSNELINSVTDMIVIKNLNSRLIRCNRALSINAGLNDPDDIYMKTDLDMVWNEGNLTPSFLEKDKLINSGVSQLNIGRYRYKDGLKTLLIKRFPVFKNKTIVANITILHEIADTTIKKIIDQAYVLGVKLDNQMIIDKIEQQFSREDQLEKFNLTVREKEVLFWFIRLDSAKAVACKLYKSHHTIYDTIERLKKKLKVNNANELREKVFDTGLIHDLLNP
ncbi:hypothetical protein [Cysteiniphilum halobium]|uniref:helix-turn-helix transcriptional regulator n=1 Tax=Cysteiniphilum halobium TaxID=2219059 RepID=UPI003F8357FC